MATTLHRFAVQVPNPTDAKTVALLRLERSKSTTLLKNYGKEMPTRALKVGRAGIALDCCAEGGETEIKVALDARSSAEVHVVIEAETGGAAGMAVFNLVDQRDGVDVGGVTLVCFDPPPADLPGSVVAPANPCPLVLAKPAYAVLPEADPAKPATAVDLASAREIDLVVPVTPSGKSITTDTRIYLEHLGASGAGFAPGTWNAGTLRPGDVFLATWRVTLDAPGLPTLRASVVASSAKTDPVRLDVVLADDPKRRLRVVR